MEKTEKRAFGLLVLAGLVVTLASAAQAGVYVDTLTGMSGLISYWNLNETSGTTAADQVAGLDGLNAGTYSGSGISLGTAGMRPTGGFVGFDDTNCAPTFSNKQQDILQMAQAAAYGGRTDLTMLGWIRFNEPNTGDVHFGGLERMGSGRYLFAAHNDARYDDVRARIRKVDFGGAEYEIMSRFVFPNDQQWHFFVMTYAQATTMTLYLDGTVKDTDSFTSSDFGLVTPTALVFGHDVDFTNAPDRGLNGQLDELAFFDRALSGAEVKQLWDAATAVPHGTIAHAPYRQTAQEIAGLRNYWQFTETSGATAADSVAANNGTYVTVPGQPFPVTLGQDGPNAAAGYVGMPAGNTSVRFIYPDSEDYMQIQDPTVVGAPGTGLSFASGVSELTMSLWLKRTYNGEGYVAGFERSGETDRYVFAVNGFTGTAIRFYALADNGVQIGSDNITIDAADDYAWHHVVQVWDGTEKRLRGYVDGREVYNATDDTMTENLFVPEGFFVGRDQLGNTRPLGAFVDELALYDRALSAAEIAELYDSAYFAGDALVPGDATRDGKVDDADAKVLAANWGTTGATWNTGDFNRDGVVNAADASLMAANWRHGVTEAAASVPEPGTLTLLAGALAALTVFFRAQRRK